MAGASREHGLSLLAAANNHGDLAVKLSSLKQVKDILLSVDSSVVAELFPYLVELQTSPECLVRKALVEAMEEIGSKKMEHCYILIPIILAYLKDSDTVVAKQSIISGTNLFCHILEELSLQFHQHGKVEKWLEELWTRMIRFKDSIIDIVCEPGPVGTRLLGMKFLETCVLLFTSDSNNSEKPTAEVVRGSRKAFNISWLVGGHPILDSVALMSEANRSLGILLDLLRSSSSLPASLTITVVNCLAAIARKRPLRYNTVLSALLDFHMNIEMGNGGHTASVFYSIRTALLGFLRCTYTPIVESRDTLLRSLRAMNAGDAADQVIRQVDKMIRYNERAPRDVRMSKDDSSSSQQALLVDLSKKRSLFLDNEEQTNGYEGASKRIHYGPNSQLAVPAEPSDSGQDYVPVNGQASKVPLLENVLTPIEQMITMIGALIAEGERGAQSLEILISNIQPDLLADIVITNMKHLPKNLLQLTRPGNLPINRQIDTLSSPMQVASSTLPAMSVNSSVLTAQVSSSPVTAISTSVHDLPVNADSKRDPRRDPRRLDPRRAAVTVEAPPTPIMEDTGVGQPEINGSVSLNKPHSLGMPSVENISVPTIAKAKSDDEGLRSPMVLETDQQTLEDDTLERIKEVVSTEITSSNLVPSPVCALDEGLDASKPSDITKTDGVDALSLMESDQQSPTISNTSASEETCHDLPPLPLYVESTDEQKITVKRLAVERIIDSCRHLWSADFSQTRMAVLARLVAQMDANEDAILMLQKNITLDYQQQKGHELVLQILYHLHTIIMSDSIEHSSFATAVYDKFLLAVVKSLLDNFPASDKSFSRLLGEIPLFPDSALKLLEDLCYADIYDHRGKEIRDVDRVTQGLGAVWSLILGRPPYRQACLNIALKSAVHSQDEIRSRAIRLVANKLYMLSYIRENIEQYATNMLLSAVDQEVSETDFSHPGSSEQRMDMEVGSQETSISGSQFSEPGASENDSVKGAKPVLRSPSNALSRQAQCLISLYFALCTKKASLLQLVFDIYGRAPKIVKQAFCRHIPILVRALGSSCSELLRIISDPPQGSEDLLSQVLQVLTEGTTPSPDLIAIVKHLYETKLKDASILIPMLSSLSKNEVIPIFPRLVDLPLEKFQLALANILQGSAHTGPALTPAEVLVAIHDITPEKDGLPIKKITDVCSACFEQRTVFTQQVLARALNHMVDQTPLPLLFMRTVIQAIDAFPTLVDFVMEILSKLVSKQLPPPPLESALNRHANLRGSLAAYASQPSIKSSLPRSILAVLGIANG